MNFFFNSFRRGIKTSHPKAAQRASTFLKLKDFLSKAIRVLVCIKPPPGFGYCYNLLIYFGIPVPCLRPLSELLDLTSYSYGI